MTRAVCLTLALCGLLAACDDQSHEPEPPPNAEQLPVPDHSGGTAGKGESALDPAVSPPSSTAPDSARP